MLGLMGLPGKKYSTYLIFQIAKPAGINEEVLN